MMRAPTLPIAFAMITLACGGAATPPATTAEEVAATPDVPTEYRCAVESWSLQQLTTETGRGPDRGAAYEDATRRLCADMDEECPGEALVVAIDHEAAREANASSTTGLLYRLLRRTYVDHIGRSAVSRAAACAQAEAAWRASPSVGFARGVSGVNGVRWSRLFGQAGGFSPPTSSALIAAIPALPHEAAGGDGYECTLNAWIAPILWRNSMHGAQGEACLESRPSPLGAGSSSFEHCDAEGTCETHCFVLGSETEVRAKGTSRTSQLEACVGAARGLCRDATCMVDLALVDGLEAELLGGRARRGR